MIPNESLSSLLMASTWLAPDNLDTGYLFDFELGGIGLNDPSLGMRVQTWTLQLRGDDVVISAENWPEEVLFTRSGVTELSLAFDQNMNPFVAFVEDGDAKFWWFDTNLPGTVFSNLPAGSSNPRCCLDDKRETQTTSSDIILAYILNDNLYFRAQRDRYEDQYLLRETLEGARLIKVGMHRQNRLQFLMQGPLPDGYIGTGFPG